MFLYKKNLLKFYTPIVLTVLIVVLFLPVISFAQGTPPCTPATQLCNPIKFNTIADFFEEVLRIAAQIGGVIIILGIIYSGFLFVTARGNQDELTKAKKAITYTVIGAIIVLGAWSFSVAIKNTINTITNTPAGS